MYCAIFCTDRAGAERLRAETLQSHIAYLNSQRGKIVWAGARLKSDGLTPYGSFYILKVPDRAAAQAFLDEEPFVKAGLFDRVEWSEVRHGFFCPELAPDPA